MSDEPCSHCGKPTPFRVGPIHCCKACLKLSIQHPRLDAASWMNQSSLGEELQADIGEEAYEVVLENMNLFAIERELSILNHLRDSLERAEKKRKKDPGMFRLKSGGDGGIHYSVYVVLNWMRDLEDEHIALLGKSLMDLSDPRSTEKVQ